MLSNSYIIVCRLVFQRSNGDLISRCSEAPNLLPLLSGTGATSTVEPRYAVNFEFEGADAGLLRLEAEFARSPGSGLFEVSQRRWIRPQVDDRDKPPPLQIAVLDFERYVLLAHNIVISSCQSISKTLSRSDWQLEIKALEFQEASSIDQALKTFSHSIQFTPGADDGLRGVGKRRVTFSNSVPVARLIEKSSVRYRLVGTNYVLEIARYDAYHRVSNPGFYGLPGQPVVKQMTETPVTSWGASVFDLQWDNLLGKHASFGLGHTAEWSPSLNTFFPCPKESKSTNTSAGFTHFIQMVKQIAAILGPEGGSKLKAIDPEYDEIGRGHATTASASQQAPAPRTTRNTGPERVKMSWAQVAQSSGKR